MIPDKGDIAGIQDGRERLLLAAARLLVAADGDVANGGLRRKAITDLADNHINTFNHHFSDTNEVLAELVDMFALDAGTQDATMEATTEHLLEAFEGDLSGALRLVGRAHFDRTKSEEIRGLQLVLWALTHNSTEHRASVSAMFDMTDVPVARALNLALERWGLEVRPPWTIDKIGQFFRALVDGFYIQDSLGYDVEDLLGLAILSCAPMFSRFVDEEHRSVDEAIAPVSAKAAFHWRSRVQESLPADFRERLDGVVAVLLDQRGYQSLTLEHVAEEMELSTFRLAAVVGDLDEIICDSLRRSMEPTFDENRFDIRSDMFGRCELVRRQLMRVQQVAAASGGKPAAVIAMMAGRVGSCEPAEALVAHIEQPMIEVLHEAAEAGELVDGVVVEQAARALVIGIFVRESMREASGGVPLDLVGPLFKAAFRSGGAS